MKYSKFQDWSDSVRITKKQIYKSPNRNHLINISQNASRVGLKHFFKTTKYISSKNNPNRKRSWNSSSDEDNKTLISEKNYENSRFNYEKSSVGSKKSKIASEDFYNYKRTDLPKEEQKSQKKLYNFVNKISQKTNNYHEERQIRSRIVNNKNVSADEDVTVKLLNGYLTNKQNTSINKSTTLEKLDILNHLDNEGINDQNTIKSNLKTFPQGDISEVSHQCNGIENSNTLLDTVNNGNDLQFKDSQASKSDMLLNFIQNLEKSVVGRTIPNMHSIPIKVGVHEQFTSQKYNKSILPPKDLHKNNILKENQSKDTHISKKEKFLNFLNNINGKNGTSKDTEHFGNSGRLLNQFKKRSSNVSSNDSDISKNNSFNNEKMRNPSSIISENSINKKKDSLFWLTDFSENSPVHLRNYKQNFDSIKDLISCTPHNSDILTVDTCNSQCLINNTKIDKPPKDLKNLTENSTIDKLEMNERTHEQRKQLKSIYNYNMKTKSIQTQNHNEKMYLETTGSIRSKTNSEISKDLCPNSVKELNPTDSVLNLDPEKPFQETIFVPNIEKCTFSKDFCPNFVKELNPIGSELNLDPGKSFQETIFVPNIEKCKTSKIGGNSIKQLNCQNSPDVTKSQTGSATSFNNYLEKALNDIDSSVISTCRNKKQEESTSKFPTLLLSSNENTFCAQESFNNEDFFKCRYENKSKNVKKRTVQSVVSTPVKHKEQFNNLLNDAHVFSILTKEYEKYDETKENTHLGSLIASKNSNTILDRDNLLNDNLVQSILDVEYERQKKKNVIERQCPEKNMYKIEQLTQITSLRNIGKQKCNLKRYRKGELKIYRLRKLKKKLPEPQAERTTKNVENRNVEDILKQITQNFVEPESQFIRSRSLSSVSTCSSYITDDTKHETLSTDSREFGTPPQDLRSKIDELLKNKTLLCEEEKRFIIEYDKNEIKTKIQTIFLRIYDDLINNRNSYFKFRRQNFKNCIFKDRRLQLKPSNTAATTVISSNSKHTQERFKLILYVMSKVQTLLETNTKLTKRELYYQFKDIIKGQQVMDRAINTISCILDVGMWALNIVAQKGLVFGDLKLLMSNGEILNCNVPGTLIPPDISDIIELQSTACFILVVEKESIFYKLIEEDLSKKLTRPFIMITGKGFPDLNTQLFLRKIWVVMSLPVFILIDADPHGIQIMLNYRFGSIHNAHVSQHLAVPNAVWLGVYPSEIKKFDATTHPLTAKDEKVIDQLLRTPYMDENPRIVSELKILLSNKYKAGIESLIKSSVYLSEVYLPTKFFLQKFV